MANELDQYTQPQAPQPAAPQPEQPAQSQGSDMAGAWRNWLSDPDNRAALMQFGISLMQPVAVGQTPLGHFGQALGSAGETLDRRKAMALKEQEASSKQDLREAQASNAETRAAAAMSNLGLQSENLDLKRMLGVMERSTKLQDAYQKAKLLDPNLTLEKFMQENRQLIALSAAQDRGGATSPGASTLKKPNVGDVVRGYRYKGGPLNDRNSWEPAQ